MSSTIFTIQVTFDDGVKVDLCAADEIFVTPADDHDSAYLDDARLAIVKALQKAQEEAE